MILRLASVLILLSIGLSAQRLYTTEDFARLNDFASLHVWAAAQRDSILAAAAGFPAAHLTKYGLKELALPAEPGQWSQHYVCPTHGVSLQYAAPDTHRCPLDGRTFTGWPYDQVIFQRRHNDLAQAARDLAFAWRITGDSRYAEKAAWILNAYSAAYNQYPLHDTAGKTAKSGARVLAQTLDESIWLIPIAWAYDLLTGFDGLDAAQRERIERDLLRAAVAVIQRNDAGISNWQSWHNAGIGAVAFALADESLIQQVVDGKSGFRFQMANSVQGEGFWYEGAWGYHFYALDAHVQLAEMAARSGIDLWQDQRLRDMFTTPLRLAMPDNTLPAFNDSRAVALPTYAGLYEVAYARTGDPLMAGFLPSGRNRNALLYGVAELPAGEKLSPASEMFKDTGFAVLRAPAGDHTIVMKFGPHGGGHGHYDKLNFVSWAFGGMLAVDPGTQSYAAPTHNSWDKVTVAHNTVVVDERTQAEATGALLWSDFSDRYLAVAAGAGGAYKTANLERTVFLTPEYALDLVRAQSADGASHQFDWVYHNAGVVRTDLPLGDYTAFPQVNGYQHLTQNRAATTGDAWQLVFDGTPVRSTPFGSTYASTANVRATFQTTPEQAANGRLSGKASYNFSGSGYVMFTAPLAPSQPPRKPAGMKMWVFGDGSGLKLSVRVNDATDERFVFPVGAVDWNGWRLLELPAPESWPSRFLGNNDGVLDLPLRTAALQLDANGTREGVLYWDDIQLIYGDGEAWNAVDFEIPYRSLRLWMLGSDATTVATGDGIGPDLTVPVPYVMARRTGTATQFVSLLEPFQTQPEITVFRRDENGGFTVESAAWADRIEFGPAGVRLYERQPK